MNWGYSPNSYSNMLPMQTQGVIQNCYVPIQVKDEAEAKSYPVAANTTISMVDLAMTHLWIKSTNASGKPIKRGNEQCWKKKILGL